MTKTSEPAAGPTEALLRALWAQVMTLEVEAAALQRQIEAALADARPAARLEARLRTALAGSAALRQETARLHALLATSLEGAARVGQRVQAREQGALARSLR